MPRFEERSRQAGQAEEAVRSDNGEPVPVRVSSVLAKVPAAELGAGTRPAGVAGGVQAVANDSSRRIRS